MKPVKKLVPVSPAWLAGLKKLSPPIILWDGPIYRIQWATPRGHVVHGTAVGSSSEHRYCPLRFDGASFGTPAAACVPESHLTVRKIDPVSGDMIPIVDALKIDESVLLTYKLQRPLRLYDISQLVADKLVPPEITHGTPADYRENSHVLARYLHPLYVATGQVDGFSSQCVKATGGRNITVFAPTIDAGLLKIVNRVRLHDSKEITAAIEVFLTTGLLPPLR